jgi:hypothetical protein
VLARTYKDELRARTGANWSFLQFDSTWNRNEANGIQILLNTTFFGADRANWKITNAYSVDGVLYMFVTRCTYPSASSDPKHRHIWRNSSVIKSTDNGLNWTRAGEPNYEQPMFPGTRFGAPYFVWYGKDGTADADGADRYVYAVSNNGYFENGDNYVLGRVPRAKLSQQSAHDWSFYTKGDGMRPNSWTPHLKQAGAILTNPGKSSMTGMTYIEGLHRYIMVAWHYHRDNFEQGIEEKDLSTVLEFFEAPKPWGPWSKVKTFETGRLGWYTPIIGQRFQTVVNGSTVKAFIYSTGFYTKPEGGLDFTLYKMNTIPITLSTEPLPHSDPAFVGGP